jgi:hypothetical protein
MLNLVGRSSAERAKSIAIGLLLGLLVLSVWQLSIENAQANREDQAHRAAVDIAQRFASALTTYDFAHPGVQGLQIAALSTTAIRDRVFASSGDVVSARASSVGDVTDVIVATLTGSTATVLVTTSQVVSSTYTGTAATLAGLLDVTVGRSPRGWLVTDYRWLLAPGGPP